MDLSDPMAELPQCIEAEKVILGSIQLDASIIDDLSGVLVRSDLYLDSHRRIFEAMTELRTDGQLVNLVTLGDALRRKGEMEQVGGAIYISSLIDFATGADTIRHYVKLVAEKAQLRRLITAAQAIQFHALEQEDPVDVIQEQAERLVAESRYEETTGGFRTVGELGDAYLDQLEQSDGTGPVGITTGLSDVDRILVTLEPETLTIIGARPSNGKSALGLTIALNATKRAGIGAFCSLEMSEHQIMQRLLSMYGRVDLARMRGHERLNREEWAKLADARRGIAQQGIRIDATRGLTAGQVCARLRRLHQHEPLSFAIIDYLTRLRFNSKRDLRHEVGDTAKAFKDLAGELHIPVIALSQLSRANVTGGHVRPPQLSDLRESGNLEEDADNVLFIHREAMYNRTEANHRLATILIAKQRQGPAPETVDVMFLGSFVKFEDLYYGGNQWT